MSFTIIYYQLVIIHVHLIPMGSTYVYNKCTTHVLDGHLELDKMLAIYLQPTARLHFVVGCFCAFQQDLHQHCKETFR